MIVKVRPYKKGGWEVDVCVTWPDNTTMRERRKAPVYSKSAAQRWGEERARFLLLQGPLKAVKEVPLLKDFKERYMEGHARANRLKASGIASKESIYKTHLLPRFGNRRLDKIDDEAVQMLKAALRSKNSKTVNCVLSVLSTTLKCAVEWGVIEKMPCRIRMLKVTNREMSFHDTGDYEKLVEAARRTDPRIHIAVLLGGDAGLRHGEMLALHRADIDFKTNHIHVQFNDWHGELDSPKSGRSRRVPMTRRLAAALQAYRHLRGVRLLYRDDGQPFSRQVLRKLLIQAERRAGLPPKGAVHKLRHTFCSLLAMRGAAARAIQDLVGHADLTMTQRYMHLSPAATESAIRLLEEPSPHRGLGDILETGMVTREKDNRIN